MGFWQIVQLILISGYLLIALRYAILMDQELRKEGITPNPLAILLSSLIWGLMLLLHTWGLVRLLSLRREHRKKEGLHDEVKS